MSNLTRTQAKVLAFLLSYAKRHGRPPTRLEIVSEFGWSSMNSAQQQLLRLEKKGFIRLVPIIARGIEIVRKS